MIISPITKVLGLAAGVLFLASVSMGFLLKSSWEKSALLEVRLVEAEKNTSDLIDGIREANARIQRVNDQKLNLQRDRDKALNEIESATNQVNATYEELLETEEKLLKEEAKKKGVVYVSPKNNWDTRGLN